ncbi:MAG: PIN domain-containing protein [Frankiaceae bacterium]|nr:PIN domain-containing protein [Frankiaceae bacterium]
MIVLDASVLIGFMFEQDDHHGAAVSLLRNVVGAPLGVSQLTLAEVLVVPTRLHRLDAAEQMLVDLGVTEVLLPSGASRRLAELRVETGLKLPDCCVLLTAQTVSGSLATFDDRLARETTSRGIEVIAA